MKKITTLIIAILATINSQGQTSFINVCENCSNRIHSFDFNSATDSTNYFFSKDTSQKNNLWQLGTPTKTVFNAGYWKQKAFVTDTLKTYPTNNISSFQFSIKNCSCMTQGPCGSYQLLWINITTKINSDTTLDGGTIEVSHNGLPWINLIEDTLGYIIGDIYSIKDTIRSMNKPGYSGNANNWKKIYISYQPEMQSQFDTITFRFTFTSDSIETNKDGWMIGLIQTGSIFEGIKKIYSTNLISVLPNPASNKLLIFSNEMKDLKGEILILDNIGRKVFIDLNFSSNSIDISNLSQGMYFLIYSNKKSYATIKFIKQ